MRFSIGFFLSQSIFDRPTGGRAVAIASALLAIPVLALYAKTAGFDYVFDDQSFIVRNPGLALGPTWEGVRWAFTSFYHANWHPLAWLAHLADRALFGPGPGPAHLVNAALHAACSVLLFFVLRRLTGTLWPSACAAALFALHPLRVESVAWVTERKDALSTIFWLLALGAYLRYARRPGSGRYALLAVLFALGLMSKPMVVTLPCVLLLLDWWPFGRWRRWPAGAVPARRLLIEKVPLLLLAAGVATLTLLAQSEAGVVSSIAEFPFGARLANALVSYVAYLGKTIWPAGLAVFYPHPGGASSLFRAAGAGFILLVLTAGALVMRRRRPWLLVGWLWYLGTLVPVIGIVQVGSQAMADRYTYLPSLGLGLALAGEGAFLARRRRRFAPLFAAAGVAAAALLALLGLRQLDSWRSQRTLFEHALAVTGRNPIANYNLGVLEATEGRAASAAALYRAAIRENPFYVEAYINYGALLAAEGRRSEAIVQYLAALHLRPDDAVIHMNLANAFDDEGRREEAFAQYRAAVRLAPADAKVHFNYALALEHAGLPAAARAAYAEALRLQPGFPEARAGLARLSSGVR